MESKMLLSRQDKNYSNKYLINDGINLVIRCLIEKSIEKIIVKYGRFNKYGRNYKIDWYSINMHFKQRYYGGDKKAIFEFKDICADFKRNDLFLKEEWVIQQLTVWLSEGNKEDTKKLIWGERRGKDIKEYPSSRVFKRYPIAKSINDLLNQEIVTTLDAAYRYLAGTKIGSRNREETEVLSKDGICSAFKKFILEGVKLPIFSFILFNSKHRYIIYDGNLALHQYNRKTSRYNLVKDWQGLRFLEYCILKADQEVVDHEKVKELVKEYNKISREEKRMIENLKQLKDIYPEANRLYSELISLSDKDLDRVISK